MPETFLQNLTDTTPELRHGRSGQAMKKEAAKANATLTMLAAKTIPKTRQERLARNGQIKGQNSTAALTTAANNHETIQVIGLNVPMLPKSSTRPPVSSQTIPESGIRIPPSPADRAFTTTEARNAFFHENFSHSRKTIHSTANPRRTAHDA